MVLKGWNIIGHIGNWQTLLTMLGISGVSIWSAWYTSVSGWSPFLAFLAALFVLAIGLFTLVCAAAYRDFIKHESTTDNTADLIPLPEACAHAYEETQRTRTAILSEKFSKGEPDKILDWYATALTESAGVTLYGAKPPSKNPIKISNEVFPSHQFRDGATKLVLHGGGGTGYHCLKVMSNELESAIKEIKSWDDNHINDHMKSEVDDADVPNMSARAAFQHILLNSHSGESDISQRYIEIGNELRDKACLGQIRVWARELQGDKGLELLPKSIWKDTRFHIPSMLHDDENIVCNHSGKTYRDAKLYEREVLTIWPKSDLIESENSILYMDYLSNLKFEEYMLNDQQNGDAKDRLAAILNDPSLYRTPNEPDELRAKIKEQESKL